MQEFEVTWSRVMSVWWLIFWRGALGSMLAGGVVGFILGFVFGVLGIPLDPAVPGLAGGIAGVLWVIVVVRMALKKRYRGFRIALVPRGPRVGEVFE